MVRRRHRRQRLLRRCGVQLLTPSCGCDGSGRAATTTALALAASAVAAKAATPPLQSQISAACAHSGRKADVRSHKAAAGCDRGVKEQTQEGVIGHGRDCAAWAESVCPCSACCCMDRARTNCMHEGVARISTLADAMALGIVSRSPAVAERMVPATCKRPLPRRGWVNAAIVYLTVQNWHRHPLCEHGQ